MDGRGTRQHAGAGILIRDGNGHDDRLLPLYSGMRMGKGLDYF
jgi:hypothetical protein